MGAICDVEFVPRREIRRRSARQALKAAVSALFAILLAYSPLMLMGSAGILGYARMAVLFFALFITAYGVSIILLNRARIAVKDRYCTISWWRKNVFHLNEIAHVYVIDEMKLGLSKSTYYLLIVGRRRRLAMISGQIWTYEQLAQLADALEGTGAVKSRVEGAVSPVWLRKQDPMAMPAWQAHAIRTALIVSVVLLVIFATVLTWAVSGAL